MKQYYFNYILSFVKSTLKEKMTHKDFIKKMESVLIYRLHIFILFQNTVHHQINLQYIDGFFTENA